MVVEIKASFLDEKFAHMQAVLTAWRRSDNAHVISIPVVREFSRFCDQTADAGCSVEDAAKGKMVAIDGFSRERVIELSQASKPRPL